LPWTADEFNTRYLADLFDSFPVSLARFWLYAFCSLETNNLTSGCHRDRKTTNFLPSVSSPAGEGGKNVQTGFSCDRRASTGFFQRSAACHHLLNWGAKDKIPIYIVMEKFSKITAFKVTIRKILNIVTAHIEGLRHPHTGLFDTLFSCQCPFIGIIKKTKIKFLRNSGKGNDAFRGVNCR
jgi:hypothetical protein